MYHSDFYTNEMVVLMNNEKTFKDFLAESASNYDLGETVILNPAIVGKAGGVGQIKQIEQNKYTIRNSVDGVIGTYAEEDIESVDEAPQDWITNQVERYV